MNIMLAKLCAMVDESIDMYQTRNASSDCEVQNKIFCEPIMKSPMDSVQTVCCSYAYLHFFHYVIGI